jgi:serine/threonine protein kinase
MRRIGMKALQLGNFKVIRKLGQGGMGIVYLAEDLALGRQVALKVLASHLVMDPDFMNRFRTEARHQARLMHPNITLLYGFEEEEGQAFLIMEFIDGENLEQRIMRMGRINPGEAIAIFLKVLDGLDYAHDQGLIHRDLKPANILLTTKKSVKIMDFGIALNLEDSQRLTRPHHIVGTPHYMAPEQILGQDLDFRTDIYALGITLFEMVTGRLPFVGDSDYEIKAAQVTLTPPSPRSFGYADITPDLEAVILKAMSKTLAARFANVREFRQGLEACIPGVMEIPSLLEIQLPQETPAPEAHPSPLPVPRTGWGWLPWLSVPISLIIGGLLSYYAGIYKGGRPKTVAPFPLTRATEPAVKPPPMAKPPATAIAKTPDATQLTPVISPTREAPLIKRPTGEDFVLAVREKLGKAGMDHLKIILAPDGRVAIRGLVGKSQDKAGVLAIAKEINPDVVLDMQKLQIVARVKKKAVPVAEAIEPHLDLSEPRASPTRNVPAPRPAPEPSALQFKFGTPEIKKIK